MKPEQLKQLEKVVRIGGKGSTRRKHKHIPRPSTMHETRLRSSLQKLPLSVITGIEQVHLSMQDGVQKVMYFPKVECSVQSNLYIISSASSEIILPDSDPDRELVGVPQLVPIKDAHCLINLQHSKKKEKKEKKPRIRCRARNKAMKAASQPDLVSTSSCTRLPAVQPDPKAAGDGDDKDAPDSGHNDGDDKDEPDSGHNDGEASPDGNAHGDGEGNGNASREFADDDPKHLVSIFNSHEGVPVEELLDILSLEKADTASSKESRLHFCSDSDSDLDQLLFGEKDSATKEGQQDHNEDQDQDENQDSSV